MGQRLILKIKVFLREVKSKDETTQNYYFTAYLTHIDKTSANKAAGNMCVGL